MTTAQFRRWLQAQKRWLHAHDNQGEDEDVQICYDAANIVREARRHAASLGLPDVAQKLRCPSPAIGPFHAQAAISAALAALKPHSKRLTPPQVARHYGVSPDTVRRWIASGELPAVNIASKKATRPRHRIEPDALKEFDRKRIAKSDPTKNETTRRRRQPDRRHPILDRYA